MHNNFLSVVTLFIIFEWLIRIGALFVIPRNRKPSSAMSWLMLIMLEPTAGLIVFILIGSPRLSKRRQEMQVTMDAVIGGAVDEALGTVELKDYVHTVVPERYQPIVTLNTNLGRMPAFSGNKLELLPDYDKSLAAIVEDIDNAQDFVHIQFFIITFDDETQALFDALENAVKRGVKVRVMLDAFGSMRLPKHRATKKKLTQIGAEWHLMLPIRLPGKHSNRYDLRNHRKIVVIDGKVGYTGSQNLIRRNYHRRDSLYYDELMVRIQGPIVAQLHGVFITDWYSEAGEMLTREAYPEIKLTLTAAGNTLAQILPSGPGYNNENNLKLFTTLIHAAREKITIVNPYFVPDDSLMVAITSAAQRGVEVIMINSEIMDQKMVGHAQRSYYDELLRAGVKIYLYKHPILLHSKFITIDNDMAVIGSSNLDMRSFQLDLEVSLVVYDPHTVTKLRQIEAQYIHKSVLLLQETWLKRPLRSRLLDNLARLTAALQ